MAKKESHVWMHFSDLMTGLMVIFLFISISYIRKVNNSFDRIKEYSDVKKELYEEFKTEFQGEIKDWNMTIGQNLTIRFNEAETSFELGRADIKDEFKNRLSEFIPRYFTILLKDNIRHNIKEVRIEGHTDTTPRTGFSDSYLSNLELSQQRSRSVLAFVRSLDFYQQLNDSDKNLLNFWISANGYSYSRSLDQNRDYSFESGLNPDNNASRRVEFRVLTNGEEVIENFIKELQKNNK